MRATALALLLFVPTLALAQTATIELPVIDAPDMSRGVPTMQQSLAITASFQDLAAVELQRAFGTHSKWGKTAVGVFDLVTLTDIAIPPGDPWLHEEWRRAVLSNRGIDSHNDVYNFDFGADSIAVSHVRDEDLIRLKRDHPADQVRLQEAGIEGELMLVERLEKERFFRGSSAYHTPLYWIVKFGTWGYVQSGATHDTDVSTDEDNRRDGANVARRDFTGHDFNGWVYDLFRPDEPYAARGIHPSGVGINRYRKSTDMTPEERAFLHKQGRLQLLNFIDPNLVGIDGVSVGGVTVNASAAHLLTSFGYAIDANVFLRRASENVFVTVHDYVNGERSFPGVEAEVIDRPITFRGRALTVSPRIGIWLQPANQRFRDRDGSLGGLAALRVATPLRGRIGSFVEVETKSAGWVAGNVHLDPATSLRFGLTARL